MVFFVAFLREPFLGADSWGALDVHPAFAVLLGVVVRSGSRIGSPAEDPGVVMLKTTGTQENVSWGPGVSRGVVGMPVCNSSWVSTWSSFRADRAGAGAGTGTGERGDAEVVGRVRALEDEPEFERTAVERAVAVGRAGEGGMPEIGARVFSVLVAGLALRSSWLAA